MIIDPITNPTANDRITLDGKEVPVLCERMEGGDRKQAVEQHRSPGYAGAYTVVKGEDLSAVTYRFHLWKPRHFQDFRPWLDTFKAAMKKRPPRVFTLGDPSVAHNEIKQVIIGSMSARVTVARGRYAYDIGFHEYRKRRPIGGVAVPAKDKDDEANQARMARNENASATLASMQALEEARAEQARKDAEE
jgi:hypothetical protein